MASEMIFGGSQTWKCAESHHCSLSPDTVWGWCYHVMSPSLTGTRFFSTEEALSSEPSVDDSIAREPNPVELDCFHSIFKVSISETDFYFYFCIHQYHPQRVFYTIKSDHAIPLSKFSSGSSEHLEESQECFCFLDATSRSNPCCLPHLVPSRYPARTPPWHPSKMESQSYFRAFAHAIHPLPDRCLYDPDQNRGEPTLRLERYPLRLTGEENWECLGAPAEKIGSGGAKQQL